MYTATAGSDHRASRRRNHLKIASIEETALNNNRGAQAPEDPADYDDAAAADSVATPSPGASPSGAATASVGASIPEFAPVKMLLLGNAGSLTPQVRDAYVEAAEHVVLRCLAEAAQTIPQDCLDEVRADPTLYDAMFAVIDPPDPSVLQNYARFRAQLGPVFMGKYRALVAPAAMENRTKGVLTIDVPGLL